LLSEVDLSDRLVVVVECFRSLCAVSPPIASTLFAPLSVKIAPEEAIPPTLRTTVLDVSYIS